MAALNQITGFFMSLTNFQQTSCRTVLPQCLVRDLALVFHTVASHPFTDPAL